MQITLPAKFEQIVRQRMKTGQYPTPEAVVEDALALLDQRPPNWTATDLKAGIAEGLKDLDDGRYLEFDESGFRRFIDELKARILSQAPKPLTK